MESATTFLGAHAIPIEYFDCPDEYTNLVCDELLPAVKEWWEKNASATINAAAAIGLTKWEAYNPENRPTWCSWKHLITDT